MGARVEAMVIERCLRLREDLPPDCFLTVNVSPHLLTEPELAGLLLGSAAAGGPPGRAPPCGSTASATRPACSCPTAGTATRPGTGRRR